MSKRKILVYDNAKIITPEEDNIFFAVSGEEKPKEVLDFTSENMKKHFKDVKMSDIKKPSNKIKKGKFNPRRKGPK